MKDRLLINFEIKLNIYYLATLIQSQIIYINALNSLKRFTYSIV
jgi:hypothetical protein